MAEDVAKLVAVGNSGVALTVAIVETEGASRIGAGRVTVAPAVGIFAATETVGVLTTGSGLRRARAKRANNIHAHKHSRPANRVFQEI